MKVLLITLTSLVVGFFLGAFVLRRDKYTELRVPGLTTEEVREALRAGPSVEKALLLADDEGAARLSVLYKLMVSGDQEKAKERLKQMLEEYYTKASSDETSTEARKAVVKRVGELL